MLRVKIDILDIEPDVLSELKTWMGNRGIGFSWAVLNTKTGAVMHGSVPPRPVVETTSAEYTEGGNEPLIK